MTTLPNIKTRRITLDNTGPTGGEQTMSVSLDLFLKTGTPAASEWVSDPELRGFTGEPDPGTHGSNLRGFTGEPDPGTHGSNLRGFTGEPDPGTHSIKSCVVLCYDYDESLTIDNVYGRFHSYGQKNNMNHDWTLPKYILHSLAIGTLTRTVMKTDSINKYLPNSYYENVVGHLYKAGGPTGTHKIPYQVTFENIPGAATFLKAYVFSYIDNQKSTLSGLDRINNASMRRTGQLKTNVIIKNGIVDRFRDILVDAAGKYYDGPRFATSQGKLFKGKPGQSRTQSDVLTSVKIPNTKIQDLRIITSAEESIYNPSSIAPRGRSLGSLSSNFPTSEWFPNTEWRPLRNSTFNAGARIDHDPVDGRTYIEATVDQEQILKRNSKFGYFYDFLPNTAKLICLLPRKYLRLINMKILRPRVTRRASGLEQNELFNANSPIETIIETGERTNTAGGTKFDAARDGLISKESEFGIVGDADLAQMTSDVRELTSNKGKRWAKSNTSAPAPMGKGNNPRFPFFRKFTAVDKTMPSITEGVYQYGISLTYEDGISLYLGQVLKDLKSKRKDLQYYYNECMISSKTSMYTSRSGVKGPAEINLNKNGSSVTRTGNFNHITNTFEIPFQKYARRRYNFKAMAITYAKAANIVYAEALARRQSTNTKRDSIMSANRLFLLLSPKNSTPEQISRILDSFLKIEELLQGIIGDATRRGPADIQTYDKRGPAGRHPKTFTVQRWFSNIEGDSSDNYVDATENSNPVASYFPKSKREIYITMSSKEFSDRVISEAEKFNIDLADQQGPSYSDTLLAFSFETYYPNEKMEFRITSESPSAPPAAFDGKSSISSNIELIRNPEVVFVANTKNSNSSEFKTQMDIISVITNFSERDKASPGSIASSLFIPEKLKDIRGSSKTQMNSLTALAVQLNLESQAAAGCSATVIIPDQTAGLKRETIQSTQFLYGLTMEPEEKIKQYKKYIDKEGTFANSMASHIRGRTLQLMGSKNSRGNLKTKADLDNVSAIRRPNESVVNGALTPHPGIKIPLHIEKLRNEPDTAVATTGYEIAPAIYSNLRRVMRFVGYKIDTNSRPILNSERWEEVTVSEALSGLSSGVYKLETFSPIDAGLRGIADPGKIVSRESYIQIREGNINGS